MNVRRLTRGKYLIQVGQHDIWTVWRGINGRWYGKNDTRPEQIVDAPTLKVAKLDIQRGYFVSLGQSAWETAMGMRGYAGSAAEREDRG